MTSPRDRRLTSEWGGRGLVLVELCLFLLVFVLASGVLFTGLGRIRRNDRVGQVGTDLRAYAAAFEQVHAASGRWPATAEGVPGLAGTWRQSSPVGGEYGWVPPTATGRPGMITLSAFAPAFPLELTRADLLEIDRRIDDGDLATGRFRTGFNGWPVYLVGDKP